jgi:hypothetical protein
MSVEANVGKGDVSMGLRRMLGSPRVWRWVSRSPLPPPSIPHVKADDRVPRLEYDGVTQLGTLRLGGAAAAAASAVAVAVPGATASSSASTLFHAY